MSEPFNLQQFLMQSGETKFALEVVAQNEIDIEIIIITNTEPKQTFNCYIEKSTFMHKATADKLKEIFARHIHKRPKGKFNSKNLYKDMKR